MKQFKRKLAALLAVVLVLGGILPVNGLSITADAAEAETKSVSLDMSIAYAEGKRYDMKDGSELAGSDEASVAEFAAAHGVELRDPTTVSAKDYDGTEVKEYGSIPYIRLNKGDKLDGLGSDGRYVMITPKHDGELVLAAKVDNGKTFTVSTLADGAEVKTFEWKNETGANQQTYFDGIKVEAGTTYYVYNAGGGTDWYEITFNYEEKKPVKLEERTVSLPMSIAYAEGKSYELADGSELASAADASVAAFAAAHGVELRDPTTVSAKDYDGTEIKEYGSIPYIRLNKGDKLDGLGSDGRYVMITPKHDGELVLAAKVDNGKTFTVSSIETVSGSDAEVKTFEWKNETGSNQQTYFDGIKVEADTTYYVYNAGGGTDWYEITFKYMAEVVEEEEPEPELPEIDLVDGVIAFPTAEGGGMYATGGRGGDVYVVTSLEDDGSQQGTLRHAINTAPAEGRIIVFNVGGTINLKSTLNLNDNITIAGQTAPGEGITVAGYDTNISEDDNLIIRFVHFRPGTAGLADGGDSIDALWGRDNDTFIIDHCSFSWNTDECLSVYRGQNGTVQYCISSESLTVSGHSKGRHGYGGIFGGDNVVFQYNLITDHTSRNPRVGGGYMAKDDPDHVATLQISNNVTYNYGYYACYGGGNAYTNYINNYLKVGPGTRETLYGKLIDYGEGGDHVEGVYIAGNVVENADGSKETDNTKGVSLSNSNILAKTPYESKGFESVHPVSAEEAYDIVLAQAGVIYPKRDAIDARVIQQVEDGTGYYINTQDDVGGYCAPEATRPADFDTDMDGIPDEWETAHGLNPNDKLDSRNLNEDGYAWVEVYFNELVEDVVSGKEEVKNPVVTIDLENNAMVDEGEDVTVTATATATNGGSISKVVFFNGSEAVYEDASAPYSYTYSGLKDGTYHISVRAYDNDDNATQSETSQLHINSTAGTGDEWTVTDIGNPGVESTASYVDGVMTVKGAGKVGKSEGATSSKLNDPTTDDFAYVYKKFSGDMEFVTRLDSYRVVDNHTYNGIMFRESLDADAASVGLGFSMNKVIENTVWCAFMVNRAEKGGKMPAISESIDSAKGAADAGMPFVYDLKFKELNTYYGIWLKLGRTGDTFTGYVSQDGVAWQTVGSLEVDLPDEIYIGLAVDAGKAGNQLENYATAKFSNLQVNTDFAYLNYEIDNMQFTGVDRIAAGEDVVVTLIADAGYLLPETIEVTKDGVALAHTYDAKAGTISLENVEGNITIKAKGVKRQVVKVNYEEVDVDNNMTVEEKDGVITATHTGLDGAIAKNIWTPFTGTGFLLFPETNNVQSMSMKLKITDLLATNDPKNTGVFVGTFDIPNNMFNSLGFRTDDGKGGTETLAGFWTKSSGGSKDSVGNGSPKQPWKEDVEYTIDLTSNNNGGFLVKFKAEDGSVVAGMDSKEFKSNECYINEAYLKNNAVRYGIAIIGATVEIRDLTLIDHEGNVIYPGDALPEAGATIEEAVDNAIANSDSAEEALDVILAYADAEMLAEAMAENPELAEKLEELMLEVAEENPEKVNSVAATIVDASAVIEDAAEELLTEGDATVKGAEISGFLNEDGVTDVELVIDKPEEEVVVDEEKYPQPMKVQLDIKLVDEDDNEVELKAPVTITIPAPKGFKLDATLKLLHYDDEGKCEEVAITIANGKVSFTVSHFSTFVFVGEPDAEEPKPEDPKPEEPKPEDPKPEDPKPEEPDDDNIKDGEDEEEDDEDEDEDKDDKKNILDAILSPKTFFDEGSFIHSILWPDTDSEQEAQEEQNAASAESDAADAQVAGGALVQNTEKGGLGNMFAIILVAAVAVIAASGVILFRKKNDEM